MKRSTIASLIAVAVLVLIGILIGRFATNRAPALDPRFGTLEEQENLGVATKKTPWDLTNEPIIEPGEVAKGMAPRTHKDH